MEYEFIHDPITGNATAKFSLEHEVIGPWLEVEVGHSAEKITELLTAISVVDSGKQTELMITGHEYSVLFTRSDVTVQTNASIDGLEVLPDSLLAENIDFDQNDVGSCGIDDFRQLLLSWEKFTND